MIHFETYNHKFTNVILLEKYSYFNIKITSKENFNQFSYLMR